MTVFINTNIGALTRHQVAHIQYYCARLLLLSIEMATVNSLLLFKCKSWENYASLKFNGLNLNEIWLIWHLRLNQEPFLLQTATWRLRWCKGITWTQLIFPRNLAIHPTKVNSQMFRANINIYSSARWHTAHNWRWTQQHTVTQNIWPGHP